MREDQTGPRRSRSARHARQSSWLARRSNWWSGRRLGGALRAGAAVMVAASAALVGIVATSTDAFANAATPTSAGVTGSVVINGNGSVTVTAEGTWTWPTPSPQSSVTFPCDGSQFPGYTGGGSEQDHFAVGWSMIWNDPTDPGYTVTEGKISEGVGSTKAVNGNLVDDTVHTYTIQVTGTTTDKSAVVKTVSSTAQLTTGMLVVGAGVPAKATITAITAAAHSFTLSADATAAHTGDSLAFFSSLDPPTVSSYNNGPDVQSSGGTVTATGTTGTTYTSGPYDVCGTYDSGTKTASGHWGPETHTYASPTKVPSTICVNMYDVHDTIGNKASEYLYTNDDNSIQWNSFTPTATKSTCFSPGKVGITPVVTTTPSVGSKGTIAVGKPVTDSALVQGVGTLKPTGSVKFTVCGPFTSAGAACTTTAKTAKALGDPSTPTSSTADSATYTSTPFTPTVPGTYCFLGTYSGDSNYKAGADSTPAAECFTATGIQPTLTTTLKSPGSTTVGNSWGDKATVTGTSVGGAPSGPVTFTFCKETTAGTPCTGAALATVSSPTASSGDTATYTLASPEIPTTAGTYCFGASYAGGGKYIGVAKQSDNECFTVLPATPTLSTALQAPAATTVGNTWSDQATVTGTAGGGKPTGSLSFSFCKENPTGTRCTGGTTVATVSSPTSTSGDTATYTLPAANAQKPANVGKYCFSASYAGAGNYTAVGVQSDTECFQVTAATSATTTQQSTTSTGTGTVTIGASGAIHDTVTVTGNATGGAPKGTVTFYLCGPSNGNALCSSTTHPEGTETLTASGSDTSTATSTSFTPTAVGTYCFAAIYNPTASGNYAGSKDNVAGTVEANECFTVGPATPTLTTTMSPPASTAVGNTWGDRATVTGNATGGVPAGTVTFFLCKETAGPCSGGTQITTVSAPTSHTGDTASYTLPAPQTPHDVGTYCFTAAYAARTGGNYSSVPSQSDNECFTVTSALPTLTTMLKRPGSTSVGNSWSDQATVTGNATGGAPAGPVTFTFCKETVPSTPCTGTTVATVATPNTSVGDAATYTLPSPQSPATVGTYCFGASYTASPGGNYSSVPAQSDTECFSVGKATPVVNTALQAPASSAVGHSWGDQAAVTGNGTAGAPTGAVTFSLCAENPTGTACSGGTTVATVASPTSVSGDTATYALPATAVQTPTQVGRYCFSASYAGTGNYAPVGVQADTECFQVTAATSTTTTQQSTSATGTGTVTIGSSGAVFDTVTVTGNSTGGAPKGTVSFTLCGPTGGNALCSATTRTEGTETLTASGADTATATSTSFTPTAVGTYCFAAVYHPTANGNYLGSSDNVSGTVEADECFTVGPAAPTLTTTMSPPVSTAVGNTWGDQATVTGNTTGGAPTGIVTFSVCKETSGPCTGGTPIATVNAPTSLSGDTATYTLPAADAQTPQHVGTYCFTAAYTATAGGNYSSVPSQADTECFTVTPATSTVTTQQSASATGEGNIVIGSGSVQDTATVTGNPTGGVPAGSVTFYVCGPTAGSAPCASTGHALGTKTLNAAGQATSTTFTPTAVGTYCFAAVYAATPGGNYLGSSDNVSGIADLDECFTATQSSFSVHKVDGPGNGQPVLPGQTIPYTVTITNSGSAAGSAIVTDLLPSNLTLTGTPACSVTSPDTCTVTVSGATVTIDVTLAPTHVATVTYDAVVSATDTATVTNTASISSGVCTTDCTATATNPVPNIAVTKAVSPASGTPAAPGSTLTYTLTVTNHGTGTGTETVSDTAPANTTLVATSAACATTATVTCTVTSSSGTLGWTVVLPAGKSTTVSFQVTVDPTDTATITNTATYSGPGCTTAPCTTDPATNPVPVLSVTKSSSPASGSSVGRGTTVTYSLVLSNAGTAAASNVTLTDAVPAGTTYVTGSASCGGAPACSVSESGGTITWSGLTIGPGSANAVTVTFQVKVGATDTNGQVIHNHATFTNVGTPSCTAATCTTNTVTLTVLVRSTAAAGSTPPTTTTTTPTTTPTTIPQRSTAAVTGATTVHTGEFWAGSRWLELLGLSLGLALLVLGMAFRRRGRRNPAGQ